MKKERVKGGSYILMISIITIFLITLVSANTLFNRIGITGKVPQDISISVKGASPAVVKLVNITNPGQLVPLGGGTRIINITVNLFDPDGFHDIEELDLTNIISIKINKTGNPERFGSCSYVGKLLGSKETEYDH